MPSGEIIVVDKRYLRFVDLFRTHDFFECHEVLEELWLECRGPERKYYQGLIQAAVSLYHYTRGNYVGARSLERLSREKIMQYPPVFLGGHGHRLIDDMRTFFDARLREAGNEKPYCPGEPLPEFHVEVERLETEIS